MKTASKAVPTTMRASAIDRFGPPSVLKIHELPVPRVGAREVLIAVDTAGVGTWEPEQRSGAWGAEGVRFPLVLGSDGSGTVVARGAQVRRFRVGDRVYGYNFGGTKGGFYAEYVAVGASKVARLPRGLDLLHAGASPAVALTALQGIEALGVKRNERVVVTGASGNVGMFALQFAKARGAHVLAIASGRDGSAFARRLGADAAVDGKRGNVAEALSRFAPDGVDAVLGLVGGKVLTACTDALRRMGRVAYPNGIDPEPRKRRGLKLVAYDAKTGVKELARLNRATEKARLIVPIARLFRLEQAAQAHRRVSKGHLLGRVVLRVARRRK
jgi:NADPH:quinone reductase-like Zn-dependent oxidoreductase